MDRNVRSQRSETRRRRVWAVSRGLLAVGCLVLAFGLSCEEESWSTAVVTAQVSKTLDPESNTASVLVGKATVENIFRSDWMETPDPGDSTFDPFPAKVTPIAGAEVLVNDVPVGQKLPGVYFKAAMDLSYLARHELKITLPDGRTVTGHAFLPDSFSITQPQPGDSFGPGVVAAVWTGSDSCQTYLVGVQPADTGSTAQGWADSRKDTSCTIPVSAFQDTLGTFVPGNYVFSVTAVNGGWNKSGLDLFLSGGNLSGAVGTFGCAVFPRPVVFRVE